MTSSQWISQTVTEAKDVFWNSVNKRIQWKSKEHSCWLTFQSWGFHTLEHQYQSEVLTVLLDLSKKVLYQLAELIQMRCMRRLARSYQTAEAAEMKEEEGGDEEEDSEGPGGITDLDYAHSISPSEKKSLLGQTEPFSRPLAWGGRRSRGAAGTPAGSFPPPTGQHTNWQPGRPRLHIMVDWKYTGNTHTHRVEWAQGIVCKHKTHTQSKRGCKCQKASSRLS